jgi:putative aldouronate transport system substrate-binding protein
MFAYGEPDVDYVYTADNKIHRNNSSWPMASYSQATFFDVTKLDNETVDQWSEVKELNNNAIPSVMLGFTMDTESVEDQIANCSAIFAKYKLQVITGASDPDVIVPQMMAELRNAGFDEIVAEAQKQVDAAYNN